MTFNIKNQIKPCGFCNCSGMIIQNPLWHGSHGYHGCYEVYIECSNCHIVRPNGKFNTVYNTFDEAVNEAINCWNDRY